MTVAAATLHTDAVAARLTAAELLVGRGGKPEGGGWQGEPGRSLFVPYAVLFPASGTTGGDLCDPHEYLDYTCQVTVVAATQRDAETVMDRVRIALVGQRPAVTGRSAWPVYVLTDRPATRDDTTAPPLHFAVAVFGFRSGPA